jgi:hypothetical protein
MKKKLSSIRITDEANDLLEAYATLSKATAQDSANAEAALMKKKVLDALEAKARKAYMEGVTFQEVVEDRPSALERYQEALRLAPDPKSLYHTKADKKILELKSGPESP